VRFAGILAKAIDFRQKFLRFLEKSLTFSEKTFIVSQLRSTPTENQSFTAKNRA